MPVPLDSEREGKKVLPYNLLAEPSHLANTIEWCVGAIEVLNTKVRIDDLHAAAEKHIAQQKLAVYQQRSAEDARLRELTAQNRRWIEEFGDELTKEVTIIPGVGGPQSWSEWKCGSCGKSYNGETFIRGLFLARNFCLATKDELRSCLLKELTFGNVGYAANCECGDQSPYFRLTGRITK